jgi:DNA-binding response OmpR family regulator
MKRNSKQQRILIVDDDADVIDLLRMSLKQAGFAVAVANDGVSALKEARSRLPDLILLDLVLPELDGFSVCETLRSERETAHVPIVMLTGLSSELNRYAGMDCGANDYLPKPVDLEKLLARVKALLAPGSAGSNLRASPSTPG